MSSPRFAPWLMPETITSGSKSSIRPERREPHAVHRRAVARVADRAVVERDLGHPQRAPERDRARGRRAVVVGRDHRELDVVERDQRAPQRLQALGVDPVVVGQQDAQHGHDSTHGPGSRLRHRTYGDSRWWGNQVAVCRTARPGGDRARGGRPRAVRAATPCSTGKRSPTARPPRCEQDEVRDEVAERIATREIEADARRWRRAARSSRPRSTTSSETGRFAAGLARRAPTAMHRGALRRRRRATLLVARRGRRAPGRGRGALGERGRAAPARGPGADAARRRAARDRARPRRAVGAAGSPRWRRSRCSLAVGAAPRGGAPGPDPPARRCGAPRSGSRWPGGATVAATAIARAIVLSTFDTSHGDAVVGHDLERVPRRPAALGAGRRRRRADRGRRLRAGSAVARGGALLMRRRAAPPARLAARRRARGARRRSCSGCPRFRSTSRWCRPPACSSSRPSPRSCDSRPLGNRCEVRPACRLTVPWSPAADRSASPCADERPLAGRIVGWMFVVGAIVTTLLPLLPGAHGEVLTPTLPIGDRGVRLGRRGRCAA